MAVEKDWQVVELDGPWRPWWRRFRVRPLHDNSSADVIRKMPGLPQMGDRHPEMPERSACQIEILAEGEQGTYLVTVIYGR